MTTMPDRAKGTTMRRIMIGLVALAVLGVGCTPEEIEQVKRIYAEQQADAIQPVAAVRVAVPPVIVDYAGAPHLPYAAVASCPAAVHITNVTDMEHTYAATYGPTQWPLVTTETSERFPYGEYPFVQPGETVTIDLAPARGERVRVYLNRGGAFTVENIDC